MGCRGSGHCGVGGECPVDGADGRHIGEFRGLLGNNQLLLPSLLFLLACGGAGNGGRGCCEALAFLGVTGMGAREPDCLFIMAGAYHSCGGRLAAINAIRLSRVYYQY